MVPVALAQSSPTTSLLIINDTIKAKSDSVSTITIITSNNPRSSRLLEEMIRRLETLRSLSADIVFDIHLFDKKYSGKGKYEELTNRTNKFGFPADVTTGSELSRNSNLLAPLEWARYRMHLKMLPESGMMDSKGTDNFLEIVCNLKNILTYTKIDGVQRLQDIHLEELGYQLNRLSESERRILAQHGVEKPCGANGFPGLGGIPGMLKQIQVGYHFPFAPEDVAFNAGKFSVWKLVGEMKPDRLASLKSFLLDGGGERDSLLQSIPTHVEIYLGQQTPFPYRIRYLCQTGSSIDSRILLFSMDFNPVYENDTSLQPKNFIYQPSIPSEPHGTVKYLKKLIPAIEL